MTYNALNKVISIMPGYNEKLIYTQGLVNLL